MESDSGCIRSATFASDGVKSDADGECGDGSARIPGQEHSRQEMEMMAVKEEITRLMIV